MIEVLKPIDQIFGRCREVARQAKVISKAEQERSVPRREDIFQENFKIVLMALEEMRLAGADVDDQAEGQGQVGAAGEEGYGLRDVIVNHLEIVLGQIRNESAFTVSDGESNIDEPDIDLG